MSRSHIRDQMRNVIERILCSFTSAGKEKRISFDDRSREGDVAFLWIFNSNAIKRFAVYRITSWKIMKRSLVISNRIYTFHKLLYIQRHNFSCRTFHSIKISSNFCVCVMFDVSTHTSLRWCDSFYVEWNLFPIPRGGIIFLLPFCFCKTPHITRYNYWNISPIEPRRLENLHSSSIVLTRFEEEDDRLSEISLSI